MKQSLANFVKPVPRYARASNLELDADNPVVSDYHLIDAGMEVLDRLFRAKVPALIVSGPYGSGKSTFALFLDALLGTDAQSTSSAAREKLHRESAELASLLLDYLQSLAPKGGPVRAIATGRTESLSTLVSRALRRGAARHAGLPTSLRDRIERVSGTKSPGAAAVDLYREVSAHAPVWLILDELGLVLDAETARSDSELWLLQELAEAVARPEPGMPSGVLIGLQHRSLAEQLEGAAAPSGWRKIQGRFEEVPFVESREAVFSLIPRVLQRDAPASVELAIRTSSRRGYERAESLGLAPFLPGGEAALNAAYPLDPAVLVVLPDLTSYYGQRERTLLAFLAGGEPHSVADFLENHLSAERPLPTLGLPELYSFFVGSGSHRIGPAGRVSRWSEIERRIREAGHLEPLEAATARAVGLLNLVGRGGAARASGAVLDFAVPGSGSAIERLVRAGLITYRSTSDEFRVWEGSDVDIEAATARYEAIAASRTLAEVLNDLAPLSPVIAAAHSEKTGVLRSFERRFIQDSDGTLATAHDGVFAYRLSDRASIRSPTLPTIQLTGVNIEELRRLALRTAALRDLQEDEQVRADWVASREVRDRLAMSLDALRGAIDERFAPNVASPRLVVRNRREPLLDGPLSRLASVAADRVFDKTPLVENEMFSVDQLTSQGARARSLLFAAMIDHAGEKSLGLNRSGPEGAMYVAALERTGIHRPGDATFDVDPRSPMAPAWMAIEAAMTPSHAAPVDVERILSGLEAPPIGLRRSLTPILWLAYMLKHSEDYGVFERGSFAPRITADLMDRLVKAPSTFTVRFYATAGPRTSYLATLATTLGFAQQGPPTVLAVTRTMVASIRQLPPTTLRTGAVGSRAIAVRQAILGAREPDALLFNALPMAVEAQPVAISGQFDSTIAERVGDALRELGRSYWAVLREAEHDLADAFALPDGPNLRTDLRVTAALVARHVIDPSLRGFLQAIIDTDRNQEEWLGAIAIAAGTPPIKEWADESRELFRLRTRQLARAHLRLVLLYTDLGERHPDDTFTARRVTVTDPGGTETSRVVWFDNETKARMTPIVDKLLVRAQRIVGPGAAGVLMAILAERLPRADQEDLEPSDGEEPSDGARRAS